MLTSLLEMLLTHICITDRYKPTVCCSKRGTMLPPTYFECDTVQAMDVGHSQLTCSQGFKNRHSPENHIGPVLSVSSKIDKTGTKFKSAKNLNGIDKPDKKLINRLVLLVYRISFEQNRFRQFCCFHG
jgi:hypothetical protein